jgi:nitrile hydratase subunit beta
MMYSADLGGSVGFGPIDPEENEPLFHAAWERRVLGFTVAMGPTGAWTGDQSRHEREKLPLEFYWSANYYDIWLTALTNLLRDRGMVTGRDLAAKRMVDAPVAAKRVFAAADVPSTLAKGFPYLRKIDRAARFSIGDQVKTRVPSEVGHTRLPTYARNKNGVIVAIHGAHVYPDSNGMGQGEDPQWLYSVRFTGAELFGSSAKDTVTLDLFEPYLLRQS